MVDGFYFKDELQHSVMSCVSKDSPWRMLHAFVLEEICLVVDIKKLHHLVYELRFFAHTGTLRLSSEMWFFSCAFFLHGP